MQIRQMCIFQDCDNTGLKFTPTEKSESILREYIIEKAYSAAVKLPVMFPEASVSVNEP